MGNLESDAMNDRKLAFIYSPEIENLSYPDDCPFKTRRAAMTRRRLLSFGLLGVPGWEEVPARQATLSELLQFHSVHYLDQLQRAASGELTAEGLRMGLGGGDTPVFPDMASYGVWAAGASLAGASLLLEGQADVAFNLLGGCHHAGASRASGFCYINDAVLACMRLAAAGKRVAYVDVDAHHGDGVQEAFYRRSDVLTISMHESGETLYPWGGFEWEIGEGRGAGYNVNLPLPAGTYDEAFTDSFDRVTMPLLGAYRPEIIVLELGMDILAGDPLTHLHMTNNVVVEVMERLLGLDVPMLVLGGGGYHVDHAVRGWALAWRTACGEDDEDALCMGLGGAMLGNSDWVGGLRDRELMVTKGRREVVMAQLEPSIAAVTRNVFAYHGLKSEPGGGGSVARRLLTLPVH